MGRFEIFAKPPERRDFPVKRQHDNQKLGQSAELDAAHAGQQRLQARHYDEDRGRYAREFLTARELRQELDEREKQKNVEPGREREL